MSEVPLQVRTLTPNNRLVGAVFFSMNRTLYVVYRVPFIMPTTPEASKEITFCVVGSDVDAEQPAGRFDD